MENMENTQNTLVESVESDGHDIEECDNTDEGIVSPILVSPIPDTQDEKPSNEVLDAIKNIYENVHMAQSIKGVFTMQECMHIIKAKDTLLDFFKNDCKDFTDPSINEAYAIFLAGVEKQQSTGVFHMQGSVDLYNKLLLIKDAIAKRKSPSDNMKELREKVLKNTQQNSPTQGASNANRGRRKRGGKS